MVASRLGHRTLVQISIPVDISTRTIRKVRNRIVPLLFLLGIVAYIDRINIGFAALTMNAELALSSEQFGLLTGMFFWGYLLFEIPSNLLLHKVGARIWIARILIGWGIVAVLSGFVQNAPQLYVARFLLGVGEAGFFPGVFLYLSYWFPQHEQARVLALFLIAAPVASIVGAPISGFLLDHVHWFGISSWRWLLILEGLPAIVGGVATYMLLPGRPGEAKFLTHEEKDWLTSELAREEREKTNAHSISARRASIHPRVWHLASIHFRLLIGFYGMTFYLPQVMRNLSEGYSNTAVRASAHQLRIDRGPTDLAVKGLQLLAKLHQNLRDDRVDPAKQMARRNAIFQLEQVEKPIPSCP